MARQLLEIGLAHKIAAQRVLHIDMPVELGGVLKMSNLIEKDIFIRLDNTDLGVTLMLCCPGGVNQHLRMDVLVVTCHKCCYLHYNHWPIYHAGQLRTLLCEGNQTNPPKYNKVDRFSQLNRSGSQHRERCNYRCISMIIELHLPAPFLVIGVVPPVLQEPTSPPGSMTGVP